MSKRLRVLALTRYARLGASSRLRFLQYFPALAAQGIDCQESALFSNAYLQALYGGGSRLRSTLSGYRQRLARQTDFAGYDLLWVEKELLPWLPYTIERRLLGQDVPYLLDYDDAWFHRYDSHPLAPVRQLLGDKLAKLMAGSACVIAGNAYLADYAQRAGARRVAQLPTVIDLDHYPTPAAKPATHKLVIGWIGSPSTVHFIHQLAPALAEISRNQPMQLRLIGVSNQTMPGVEVVCRPWSEASEAAEIAEFDLGVMPLPDEPWERGKCGYKLIQYMACGKPVIASPVGVNCEIVQEGVNGMLAGSHTDWCAALATLATDVGLRQQLGAAGRQRVETHYSLQIAAPQLAAILRESATGAGR
ncbi:glycosyltransferase family 4 protein [Parachitinimonas caeni]|uniref:Glycosyltransferase family 4 protein n=1 Tax=Parachitinimonas caeni TaxID=3031301 RepID=A0ABT7DW60_9NEIS|nr:glycosyltransferase family 4 protein [Parachitinimonas caeni]MDK2122892.1 glycosyltransferase family 4 protein [Parachitinimonas caeni]